MLTSEGRNGIRKITPYYSSNVYVCIIICIISIRVSYILIYVLGIDILILSLRV